MWGLRKAVVSAVVSRRSCSPVSWTACTWLRRSVVIATRSFSTSASRALNASRLARTGTISCSVAFSRTSAEASTDLP